MDQPIDLIPAAAASRASLKILAHHLYEYDKGVRRMFMMTLGPPDTDAVVRRLCRRGIGHHIHPVSPSKTNVFFGHPAWIDTVRMVVCKPLNQLTPEEDFILGTLLGYDREQQCRRFLALAQARAGVCAAE